jgi:2-alkenal reductase
MLKQQGYGTQGRTWPHVWAVVLACVALGACAPAGGTPSANSTIAGLDQAATNAQPPVITSELVAQADAEYLLLTNIYHAAIGSVVNLEVVPRDTDDNSFQRGSGFVYDTAGHILTNAHVVLNAVEVRVKFNDGYMVTAEVIGADTYSDVAVLRVQADAERLRPLAFGDSAQVAVGQRAIVLGNPFGLVGSMTLGIVSGVERQLQTGELLGSNVPGFQNPSIIQIDADVGPGNSGGPLLNSMGEVVGMNTSIQTISGAFEGVGFAIPTDTLRRVVPELIATGRVNYAWIGITSLREDSGITLTSIAEPLQLSVRFGVLIRGVTRGSPAERAGLRGGTETRQVWGREVCIGGDIIVAINGIYINDMREFTAYLFQNTRPNDEVKLLVVREDDTFEVPVTLQARPTQSDASGSACG